MLHLAGATALLLFVCEALLGWPWNTDMIFQPILRPYRRILMVPAQSVPLHAEATQTRQEMEQKLRNPLTATAETLALGQRMFNIYCAPCHGAAGDGRGLVASPSFVPANLLDAKIHLHDANMQSQSDAAIFSTITNGWLSMPAYRETMTVHQRWAVVTYVRHLQQEAKQK